MKQFTPLKIDQVSSVSWVIMEKEGAWASGRGRKQILSSLRVSNAGYSLISHLVAKLSDFMAFLSEVLRVWFFKLCFEILRFHRPSSAPSVDGTLTLTFWVKFNFHITVPYIFVRRGNFELKQVDSSVLSC